MYESTVLKVSHDNAQISFGFVSNFVGLAKRTDDITSKLFEESRKGINDIENNEPVGARNCVNSTPANQHQLHQYNELNIGLNWSSLLSALPKMWMTLYPALSKWLTKTEL